MKTVLFWVAALAVLTTAPAALAQPQQGGVDKWGTWHVGEGLEHGDYFHYILCHVDYMECRNFEFEFWIKGDVAVGSETHLLAEVLVRDGSRVVIGNMTLGNLVPEPTGSSQELNEYRRAFGSSVTWLSAFAPVYYPQSFSDISWGKIGGLQILPTAIEYVTVPAGTWEDAVVVSWLTAGAHSRVWVADGFPFPIKAETFLAQPTFPLLTEYEFELQNYGNFQESPFVGIVSTSERERAACEARSGGTVPVMKATDDSKYQIRASYGPEHPEEGCRIELSVEFLGRDGLLVEQIQFDVVVMDDDGGITRSIAYELGSRILYAQSGTYHLEFDVREPPGIAEYAIVVYGSAPDWVVPDQSEPDMLVIPVEVRPNAGTVILEPDGIKLANEAGHARSPLAQVRDGVPANEVTCSDARVLMESPSGMPACVFAESADVLERRGFVLPSEAPRDDLSAKQQASEKAEETGTVTLPDSGNPDAGVITYTIVGGDMTSIMPIVDAEITPGIPGGALLISINATDDGYVILTIPRVVADAGGGPGKDIDYFVLVDGEEVDYKESKTDYARTLTIDFVAGSEEIKIIGTFVAAGFDTMEKEEVIPPLKQVRQGVPTEQVLCNGNKILLSTPSGMPACIYPESVGPLIDRGFEKIVPVARPVSGLGANPEEPRPIPAEIASASNAFAFDFYRQIADEEGNHFFSPASIHTAFSMLYEGARGETAGQLRGVFGMAEDDAARHPAVSDTMSSLNRDDPHAALEMANSLWLAERLVPHARYVEIVRGTYAADMETVDFTDRGEDGAVYRINGWAAEKTRDKIPKVLQPDDVGGDTLAAILNAIYFKGTWGVQFDPADTRPRDFDTGNGTVQADMMHVDAVFGYAEHDGTQILRMPYVGDRLSMLVVLPPGLNGMASLEESLTAEVFEEWQQGMHDTDIAVSIPKFEAKTHYDLIPELKDLGITLIFGSGDFGGISDASMFVTKAVQDAYVKVNEEGTEAAAVTTIILGESEPPTFIADRPFLFIIQDDESGTILFMGKITDPTA